MHFSESTIGSLPEFGVAHRPQEVIDLLLLVLRVGLDLQAINLLQNLGLFVQKQLKRQFLLLLAELS